MTEEHNRKSLEEGLKMNMKKTKVMFSNHLAGQQIMIGNKNIVKSGRIFILGTNN